MLQYTYWCRFVEPEFRMFNDKLTIYLAYSRTEEILIITRPYKYDV
jgi:hypothetical protein